MGSYIENHLVKGEKVKLKISYHWITFFSIASIATLFIYPYYKRRTTELAITNSRVIVKSGFLTRRIFEMNIHSVESLDVNQSLLGRILNYGEIRIVGTGGRIETYKFVSNPMIFRMKFREITI